jgi:hypothetical protein
VTHAKRLGKLLAKNELEVEHILELAHMASIDDAPNLRLLQLELDSAGENEIPFTLWLEAVCTFLEGGYDGLESLAASAGMLPFVVGVIEELANPAAVRLLARLVETRPNEPGLAEFSEEIATAANQLTSVSPDAPGLDEETAAILRSFLHSIVLKSNAHESAYAIAIYGLRGLGDETSLRLLDKVEDPEPPYSDARELARKAIKRRLHN